MRVLSLFLLIISFASCQNKIISDMNDDLDSLDQELVKIDEKMAEIKPDTIQTLLDTIDFDMTYLELYLDDDTLPRPLAISIGSYSDQKRNLQKWQSAYKDHVREMAYAKNQVKSLRQDVNNGMVPKELFDKAKPSEAKAIAQLGETAGNLKVWYNSNLERFDYLKQKVDSISGIKVQ